MIVEILQFSAVFGVVPVGLLLRSAGAIHPAALGLAFGQRRASSSTVLRWIVGEGRLLPGRDGQRRIRPLRPPVATSTGRPSTPASSRATCVTRRTSSIRMFGPRAWWVYVKDDFVMHFVTAETQGILLVFFEELKREGARRRPRM